MSGETPAMPAAAIGHDPACDADTPPTLEMAPVGLDREHGGIAMMDLSRIDLGKPFFDDAVAAAAEEIDPPRRLPVAGAAVIEAARLHGVAPTGFVFHAARCGSTLLANLLAAEDRAVVLKEPGILDALLLAWSRSPEPALADLIAASLRLLVAAAGNGGRTPVIVKLSAWAIAHAGLLLDRFPDAAVAFLHRAPEETIASWLAARPGWFDRSQADPASHALLFPEATLPLGVASPQALFLSAWESMARSALALRPRGCRMLSYARLVAEPEEMTTALFRHFVPGAPLPSRASLDRIARGYSKADAPAEAFDPGGPHRRPALPPALRREIDARLVPLFTALGGER